MIDLPVPESFKFCIWLVQSSNYLQLMKVLTKFMCDTPIDCSQTASGSVPIHFLCAYDWPKPVVRSWTFSFSQVEKVLQV